jgi:hypothetical protein
VTGQPGTNWEIEMQYEKTMEDVKRALDSVKRTRRSPRVTENSPGVVATRAAARLKKVAAA